MPLVKTQAVVLGSKDFGESDRIVTFFTAQVGKVRGMAKGAKRSKKRFGVNLDLFVLVNLYLRERPRGGFPLIEDCDLVNPFFNIRQSLERITLASYLLELVSAVLTEGEANPGLFQLMVSALSLIDEGKETAATIPTFEVKLLSAAGLAPELNACLVCRQELTVENKVAFSPLNGGLLCPSCTGRTDPFFFLSKETVIALRDAQKLPWERAQGVIFTALSIKESHEALSSFLRIHLGKELKSWRFLDKPLG